MIRPMNSTAPVSSVPNQEHEGPVDVERDGLGWLFFRQSFRQEIHHSGRRRLGPLLIHLHPSVVHDAGDAQPLGMIGHAGEVGPTRIEARLDAQSPQRLCEL